MEPNPVVGALVVRSGRTVARGWHARFGGPHAEAHALEQAGRDTCEATLYVSLEPCSRQGKTPPCTQRIIDAGITHVVFGAHDDTQNGAAPLEAAGIRVTGGLMEDACRRANPYFFRAASGARPFVMAKWAMSSDGHISTPPGRSKWISCEDSRDLSHHWRAAVDAIAVGIGTVLADDPLLTCRVGLDSPPRIVFDATARTPLDSRLVLTAESTPVVIVTADDAPPDRVASLIEAGCTVLPVGRSGEGIDLHAALGRLLRDLDIRTLMVEGGSRVLKSFLSAGLVDETRVFLAPVLFGDGVTSDAPSWTMDALALAMNDGGTVQQVSGGDLLLITRATGAVPR